MHIRYSYAAYTHTRICACAHTSVHIHFTDNHTYAHRCAYTYLHTYVRVRVQSYMHGTVHTCVHIPIHIMFYSGLLWRVWVSRGVPGREGHIWALEYGPFLDFLDWDSGAWGLQLLATTTTRTIISSCNSGTSIIILDHEYLTKLFFPDVKGVSGCSPAQTRRSLLCHALEGTYRELISPL